MICFVSSFCYWMKGKNYYGVRMHGLLANNGPLFNLSTSESSLVVPSSKTCQTFQKQKKKKWSKCQRTAEGEFTGVTIHSSIHSFSHKLFSLVNFPPRCLWYRRHCTVHCLIHWVWDFLKPFRQLKLRTCTFTYHAIFSHDRAWQMPHLSPKMTNHSLTWSC